MEAPKTILSISLFIVFAIQQSYAATASGAVKTGLSTVNSNVQSFTEALAAIEVVLGVIFIAAGFYLRKKANTEADNMYLFGKILIALGILVILFGIGSLLFGLLAPAIVNQAVQT